MCLNRSPSIMMITDEFIRDVQRFTAISAIGVSALRRQGVGAIRRIQDYLATLDLSGVAAFQNEDDFKTWIQNTTQQIMNSQNGPAIKWGAARKALNLFLRDALYNKYLSDKYNLSNVENWLEVPLDSIVAQHLKREAGRGKLPIWNGLRKLTLLESKEFQNYANSFAQTCHIARIHLDVGIWVNNRG